MRKKAGGVIVSTEHGNEYVATLNKSIAQQFETIEYLDRVVARNPSDPESYFRRAMAYSKKGLLRQAVDDLDRVVKLDPYNATVYGNRGSLYIRLGDFARVIADCSRAIKFKPDYAYAWTLPH
jgi:tetratricopeptide (TPR) repeat protein